MSDLLPSCWGSCTSDRYGKSSCTSSPTTGRVFSESFHSISIESYDSVECESVRINRICSWIEKEILCMPMRDYGCAKGQNIHCDTRWIDSHVGGHA